MGFFTWFMSSAASGAQIAAFSSMCVIFGLYAAVCVFSEMPSSNESSDASFWSST